MNLIYTQAEMDEKDARIRELEAALRNVLKPWDGWIFSDESPIGKARLLLASTSEMPLEAAFAKEPERSIIDAALRKVGSTPETKDV